MAYLEWSEKFSVGVKEFDEQHREIVAMINRLHDATAKGSDGTDVTDTVHQLIDYASRHFRTEECYMMQYSYAEYETHEAEHDRFIKRALDFQQRLNSRDAVIADELLVFLKDWLVKHILGTDCLYSKFFNSKGLR